MASASGNGATQANGAERTPASMNFQAFMGHNEAQLDDNFGEESAKRIKELREKAAQREGGGSPVRAHSNGGETQGNLEKHTEEEVDALLRQDMEKGGQLLSTSAEDVKEEKTSKRRRLYELGKLPFKMGAVPFHLMRKGYHHLRDHEKGDMNAMEEEEVAVKASAPTAVKGIAGDVGAPAMQSSEEDDLPVVLRPLAAIGDPRNADIDQDTLCLAFALVFEAIESPLVCTAKYPPVGYLAAISAAQKSASKGVVEGVSDLVVNTMGSLTGVVGSGAKQLLSAAKEAGRLGKSAVSDTMGLWSDRKQENISKNQGKDTVSLESIRMGLNEEEDTEQSLTDKRAMKRQLQAASSVSNLNVKPQQHPSAAATATNVEEIQNTDLEEVARKRFHASGAESLAVEMLRYSFSAFNSVSKVKSEQSDSPVLESADSVAEFGKKLLVYFENRIRTSWSLEEYARCLRRAIIKCRRQLKTLGGKRRGYYNQEHFDSPEAFDKWKQNQMSTLNTAISLYEKYLRSLQPLLAEKRKPKKQSASKSDICTCCPWFKSSKRRSTVVEDYTEDVGKIGEEESEYDSDEPWTAEAKGCDTEFPNDRDMDRPQIADNDICGISSASPRSLLPVVIQLFLAHSNDFAVYCESVHRWEQSVPDVYDSDKFEKLVDSVQFSICHRITPVCQVLLQEYSVRYRISYLRYRTEVLTCLSNNLMAATVQRQRLVERVVEKYAAADGDLSSKLKEGKLQLRAGEKKIVHESTLRLYQYYRYLISVIVDIQEELQSVGTRNCGGSSAAGRTSRLIGWAATETDLRYLRNSLRLIVHDCYKIFRNQESFFPIITFQCRNIHETAVEKEKKKREKNVKDYPALELLQEYFSDRDELASSVEQFSHANEGDPTFVLLLEIFYRAWTILQVLTSWKPKASIAMDAQQTGKTAITSMPFIELLSQLIVENNRVKYQELRSMWIDFITGSNRLRASSSSASLKGVEEAADSFLGSNALMENTKNVNVRKTVTLHVESKQLESVIVGAGGVGGRSVVVLENEQRSASSQNSLDRATLYPGDEISKIDEFSLSKLERERKSADSDDSDDETLPVGPLKTAFCREFFSGSVSTWYDKYLEKPDFSSAMNKKRNSKTVTIEVEREHRESSVTGKVEQGPLNCIEVVLDRLLMSGFERQFARHILGSQASFDDLDNLSTKFRPVVCVRVRKQGDSSDATPWTTSPLGGNLSCNWNGYRLRFPLQLLRESEGKCVIDFEVRVPPFEVVSRDDGAQEFLETIERSPSASIDGSGDGDTDNNVEPNGSNNPFSFVPRAAKFVASGIGWGIKKGAHYAVAVPSAAARKVASSIRRSSKTEASSGLTPDKASLSPEEDILQNYIRLACKSIDFYVGDEKSRSPPKVFKREHLLSETEELKDKPLFIEIALGFVHYESEDRQHVLDDEMSVGSAESNDDGNATSTAFRESEQQRLSRLFSESMGSPLTVEQMCVLSLAVTGSLRELEMLDFLASDLATGAVRSIAYETFWKSYIDGSISESENNARTKYPKLVPLKISVSQFQEYLSAVRRYLLADVRTTWKAFTDETSCLISMPHLEDAKGNRLKIHRFSIPEDRSRSLKQNAKGFAVCMEPVASARTVASSILLGSLLHDQDSIVDISEGTCTQVRNAVEDTHKAASLMWFYSTYCAFYSSLRVDIRRGLMNVRPSPSNIVEGILGEQGIMSVIRELNGLIREKNPPCYFPLLNVNTVFELYVPGWSSARRKKAQEKLVPTAVKQDNLVPLKPDFGILHSSSAQNVFWICMEFVGQFKRLPRASKEENIARFVQHLLVDPLIQYTESQSAMMDRVMNDALRNKKHPLQSFWSLGDTSSDALKVLKELCVRINNVHFTKQKLFGLLQKVNDIEGVYDSSLDPSARSKRNRKDSDESTESKSKGGAVIDAIRIYRLSLYVDKARDLPRMDAGGLGRSDPYVDMELASSLEELQAGMSEKAQTKVIKSNSNPQWGQEFQLVSATPDSLLRLQVYDWNNGRPSDFIGSVTVPIAVLLERGTHRFNTGLRRPRSRFEGKDDLLITDVEDCIPYWERVTNVLGDKIPDIGSDQVSGNAAVALSSSIPVYTEVPDILSDSTSETAPNRNAKRELKEWLRHRQTYGRARLEFTVKFEGVFVGKKAEEAVGCRLDAAVSSLCRGMHRHIRPLVVDAVTGDHAVELQSKASIPASVVDKATAALLTYLDEQLATLNGLLYQSVTQQVLCNLWKGVCVELLYLLLPTIDHDNDITRPVDEREREKASKVSKNFFKFWSFNKVNWLSPEQVRLVRGIYGQVKEFLSFNGEGGVGLNDELAKGLSDPLTTVLDSWSKSVTQLKDDMHRIHGFSKVWADEEKGRTGASRVNLGKYSEPGTGMSFLHYREILHYHGDKGKVKEAYNRYKQALTSLEQFV